MNAPILGVKIYYDDGVVASIPAALFLDATQGWGARGATRVQAVVVYYDRTYETFVGPQVKGQTKVTRAYRDVFVLKNHYWFRPLAPTSEGRFGWADSVPDIPADAVGKSGSTLLDAAFYAIYNAALDDFAVPI